MDLEDAERWRKLEQRARERGWTIDSLAEKGRFAVMVLAGHEGPLAIGDLDSIEAFLKSHAL